MGSRTGSNWSCSLNGLKIWQRFQTQSSCKEALTDRQGPSIYLTSGQLSLAPPIFCGDRLVAIAERGRHTVAGTPPMAISGSCASVPDCVSEPVTIRFHGRQKPVAFLIPILPTEERGQMEDRSHS
jgi:hypothetical protein